LHNHSEDTQSYTYSRRPVTIVFTDHFANPGEAIDAEKQVKGWVRKKKEALIEGRFDLLRELSECVNETSHKNQPSHSRRPSFDSAQDDQREQNA
jgi:putative endonuclease